MTEHLTSIIESLVFVSEGPISMDRLKKILPEFETTAIKKAVADLQETYETSTGSIRLCHVAGGLQFRTKPSFKPWIARLREPSPQRLSNAALETLAIIAYKQPIIRSEIEHIRGVDCGGTIRLLLEKNLIKVLGRKELPGRPLIYATTNAFLEVFGLSALKDLPTPKEIAPPGDAHTPVTQIDAPLSPAHLPDLDDRPPSKGHEDRTLYAPPADRPPE